MKTILILLLQAATSTTPVPTSTASPSTTPTTATPAPTVNVGTSAPSQTAPVVTTPLVPGGPPASGSTASLLPTVTLPVCLTRTVVDANGERQPFLIVLPTADVAALTAGDFQVTACGTARFDAGRYRDVVCRVAAAPNEAVQNRYVALFGVRAQRLCDVANLLGGDLVTLFGGAK